MARVPPRSRRDLDEDDVRVRPGRGKSRPRSKDRPGHEDATTAWVVAVDRGRFTCALGSVGDGGRVTAMKARELGRKGVVVGDRVHVVGDLEGGPDSLARIVRVEPRTSVLRRTADDADPVERVVVANATQLAVVTSLADPPPRPRLVDRCLVAAYDAGLAPTGCSGCTPRSTSRPSS
jgi:ribosome biogenesis GTPase / thiamine phosphate phosphatase